MKVKALVQAIAIAAALAAPALTFAQPNAPVTRAQVRADLVQVEQAGYRPGDGDEASYPVQVEQAEARVARNESASGAYGGAVAGSSATGSRAARPHLLRIHRLATNQTSQ